MRAVFHAAAALAVPLFLTSASIAADQPIPPLETSTKPGEGVLCLWALTSVASEVGKSCPGKNDPEVQAALEESVARLERYVTVNGKWSAESIERFKRQQGAVGQTAASLCTTEGLQMYDAIRSQGAAALRVGVNKAVARPGTPAWGDCV